MKYLEPRFSIDPPAQVTACMRCVYGRGEHAEWCPARVSAEDLRLIAEHVRHTTGVWIGEGREHLVMTRLAGLLQDEHLPTLHVLCEQLRAEPAGRLAKLVAERIPNHDSLFFRDGLPGVREALSGLDHPARVWSAGCSTGQEPYSVAMLMLEHGIHGTVLATDISAEVLHRAEIGRYRGEEIERQIPPSLLAKYFVRTAANWMVKESVHQRIRFRRADIRLPLEESGPFDLILCRNVLVYFDLRTRGRVLSLLRSALAPGGSLLLGRGEAQELPCQTAA